MSWPFPPHLMSDPCMRPGAHPPCSPIDGFIGYHPQDLRIQWGFWEPYSCLETLSFEFSEPSGYPGARGHPLEMSREPSVGLHPADLGYGPTRPISTHVPEVEDAIMARLRQRQAQENAMREAQLRSSGYSLFPHDDMSSVRLHPHDPRLGSGRELPVDEEARASFLATMGESLRRNEERKQRRASRKYGENFNDLPRHNSYAKSRECSHELPGSCSCRPPASHGYHPYGPSY